MPILNMEMECNKCEQEIKTKKELVIGYAWSYFFGYNMVPLIRSYHLRCFNEHNSNENIIKIPQITLKELDGIQKKNREMLISYSILGVIVLSVIGISFLANGVNPRDILVVLITLGLMFIFPLSFPIRNLSKIKEIQKI